MRTATDDVTGTTWIVQSGRMDGPVTITTHRSGAIGAADPAARVALEEPFDGDALADDRLADLEAVFGSARLS